MNPSPAPSPTSAHDLFSRIQQSFRLPGIIAVVLDQPGQPLATATFTDLAPAANWRDVWRQAVATIDALHHQNGPGQDVRWQGHQRTFWIASRHDGARLGLLHAKTLEPNVRDALEESVEEFRRGPTAAP